MEVKISIELGPDIAESLLLSRLSAKKLEWRFDQKLTKVFNSIEIHIHTIFVNISKIAVYTILLGPGYIMTYWLSRDSFLLKSRLTLLPDKNAVVTILPETAFITNI